MRKPAIASSAKAQITSVAPMRPSSSPMTAKIMSVCASGRYETFPTPSPRPAPVNAARADPDRRLHDLEAGALRVAPRVEEAEDARAAVRLDPDRERARAPSARTDATDEQPDRHAGDEEDREHHPAERDRRPEVGLDDDQAAEERR